MEVKLREKIESAIPRPSSIADRLNLLNTAQIGWKERVEETDAKRFTVAHKLAGKQSKGSVPNVSTTNIFQEIYHFPPLL